MAKSTAASTAATTAASTNGAKSAATANNDNDATTATINVVNQDGSITVVDALEKYDDQSADRVQNLHDAATALDLSDQHVRTLVRKGHLQVTAHVIPSITTIFVITPANLDQYRKDIASQKFSTRDRSGNTTAYVVKVPNDAVGAFIAWCEASGYGVPTLRNKPASDDKPASDEQAQAASDDQETTA